MTSADEPTLSTPDMAFQNPPREDRFFAGGWVFQVAPQDPRVTITATTTSGTVVPSGRFYMLSTRNPDGYLFTWTPANPGDTPQDVVFTATRPDGTTSTMTYRPTSSGGAGTTAPTAPPAVAPTPASESPDMSFQNTPGEDHFFRGAWNFQVAPHDPRVTITATTASGTVVQSGRFYMLSTKDFDGYNFMWTPANPGDTPQEVVFTATRPDGTTSTLTYPSAGSGGAGTTAPTAPPAVPPKPTYPNLRPALNDPALPPPPYDPSDTTIGPQARNSTMQVLDSYWDTVKRGWMVTVWPSTARLPITASSPDGQVSEFYEHGYRWVGSAFYGTEDKYHAYQFLLLPTDGLDWSSRYPRINFTAPDAAGVPATITFRRANPSNDASTPLPTPDPKYFPPTGPTARNNEMQILPTTHRNSSGWAIDVLQVPWVTVTAASNGNMRRWSGSDASNANYLWTGHSGATPIVVLTAHYTDGRTSTITYLAHK